ncbi:MAG: 23S rRNA (pseudouridine(1915)-N(3))-methyltransferase RlmH [Culicoidibacterales bacterium]
MLKVEIIAMGNLKEKYWVDAINEYRKRLTRYCKLTIIELKEATINENASNATIEHGLNKEASIILTKIKPEDFVIALAIRGQMFTSEFFARELQKFEQKGKKIIFVIGSSHGLHADIYKRSNMEISCSAMTFPHQMIRLIFIEQLYRAYKINKNEKYHK